jgi:hypothetical protein
MSKSTDQDQVTIRPSDEVLFRLRDGARPLECTDSVVQASYELGVNVIHMGVVMGLGYYGGPDGTPALALDDDTIVALGDIDPESFTLHPAAGVPNAT